MLDAFGDEFLMQKSDPLTLLRAAEKSAISVALVVETLFGSGLSGGPFRGGPKKRVAFKLGARRWVIQRWPGENMSCSEWAE